MQTRQAVRSEIFETMSVPRLFWACVLPGSVSMAAGALYVVVDGMFVGHYMGSESLAAANMMWPLLGVVFALASMIGAGSSVQIAKYLGMHERHQASRTFSSSVALTLCLGVLMCVAGFLLTDPFLKLLGASEHTAALSSVYIRSYLLSGPLVCLYYAVNSYLRVCGLQKLSMWLNVFTSLLNLVLDYVFIVILREGIWCASFTTCVSLSLGAVIGMAPFVAGKTDLRLIKGFIPFSQLKRMLANGVPEFLEEVSVSFLMLIVNAALLRLGGTAAVAANAAVLYIGSVVMMMLDGMTNAMQPALSYCYGARLYGRVGQIAKWLLHSSAVFAVCACAVMELWGPFFISLYAQAGDDEFVRLGVLCIRLFSLSYLFIWAEITLRVFLTALESPGRAFVLSMCRSIVFPLGSLALCASVWGLEGIWGSAAVAALLSALLGARFARALWRSLNAPSRA